MTTTHEQTDSSNTNTLLALLAGAGAGLAIGILLAPKAGEKLRAEIGTAVNGYLDAACVSAERAADNARAMVTRAVDTSAKDAHSAINQTVVAVENGAKRSHEAVDRKSTR